MMQDISSAAPTDTSEIRRAEQGAAGPKSGLTPMLVRFGRMGDMVLQAPLLHLLHRRYGRPCILFGTGPWARELYAGHPDVDVVWQLRNHHMPLLLSPQSWPLVKALHRHAGPIYVSENMPRQRERVRALLARTGIDVTRCIYLDPDAGTDAHWVDRLLDFGKTTPLAFDAETYAWCANDLQRAPHLPILAEDRRDLAAWRAQRGIEDAPFVLIQPGNKRTNRRRASRQSDSKAWPLERWVAVLHALRARHPALRFVLCGGADETAMLDAIRRDCALDRVDVAARDLPLRRLLALAEQAHSMIAVDTGPAHVAAAAGCPLLVLYGAETPARWDRRSPNGSPVLNLGGPPQRHRVDQIPAEEVTAAWERLAIGRYGSELIAASAA